MPFAPTYIEDCVLTLDGDAFQAEVSSAKFVPSVTTTRWKGLTPTSVHSATSTEWVLEVTVGQDYDTLTSLSNYLLANPGITVAATFEPRAGGATFTASVTLAPIGVGGNVSAFAEDTVSLPSTAPVAGP
jgi:hypothetical protein